MYLTGLPEREPLQGGGPWISYLTGVTRGAIEAIFGDGGPSVPPSDGYNAYRELRSPAFSLLAGTRQLRVQAPKGMILDWLRVEPAP